MIITKKINFLNYSFHIDLLYFTFVFVGYSCILLCIKFYKPNFCANLRKNVKILNIVTKISKLTLGTLVIAHKAEEIFFNF
jgi:hypothetical protein